MREALVESGFEPLRTDDDSKPAMQSERQLWSSMIVTLAGWAMEHTLLGQVTTGSERDIQRATRIAMKRCEAAGAEIEMPLTQIREGLRVAIVGDPDGNSVELVEQT